MKRLTKMQRIHQAPYNAGVRKGRQLERARALRLIFARIGPYEDDSDKALLNAYRAIKKGKP